MYNKIKHKLLMGAATITLAATEPGSFTGAQSTSTELSNRVSVTQELGSLQNATGWINSKPLTRKEIQGKVVLIDFWTYTCINWLRTLPYVRAWAKKYESQGLVVIGVHTPEFPFEHNIENVRQAVLSMMIEYPVAIDND
jgi:thiol-disulfide isomerase/thioredoxin